MEFGELVEPDTRAFWANYDEFEEESIRRTSLAWKWMSEDFNVDKMTPFKELFIIEGKMAFDFVSQTILNNLSPLCQIDGYPASVYKIPNTDSYICVAENSDLDQSARITDFLRPWLENAQTTYIFTLQAAFSYTTWKEFDKRCFIRFISNEPINIALEDVAPMEDCNFIHGLSAAAASWRHIHNKPFSCYAVYMDCTQIDSFVATKFLALLNCFGLKSEKNFVMKTFNKSNLYL